MPTQVEMRAELKRVGIKGGSTMKKGALQAAYTQMLAEDKSPVRAEGVAPATEASRGAGRTTAASLSQQLLGESGEEEDDDDGGKYEGLSEEEVREHGTASKPLAHKVPGEDTLKIWNGKEFKVKDVGPLIVGIKEATNRDPLSGEVELFGECSQEDLVTLAEKIAADAMKLVRRSGCSKQKLAAMTEAICDGGSMHSVLTLVEAVGALDQWLFPEQGPFFGTLPMDKIMTRFYIMEELYDQGATGDKERRRADVQDARLEGWPPAELSSAQSVADVLGQVQGATIHSMADEAKVKKE
jgi:hypothetical protein